MLIEEKMCENSALMGEHLRALLEDLKAKHPTVSALSLASLSLSLSLSLFSLSLSISLTHSLSSFSLASL